MKVLLRSSVPRERVETDSAVSGLPLSGGDSAGIGPDSLPESKDPRICTQRLTSRQSPTPVLLLGVNLGRVPWPPSGRVRPSGSRHFGCDIVIKHYEPLPRWEEHGAHRGPPGVSCFTYVISITPPSDLCSFLHLSSNEDPDSPKFAQPEWQRQDLNLGQLDPAAPFSPSPWPARQQGPWGD